MGCPPSSGAVQEILSEFAVVDVTAMLLGAPGVIAGVTVIGVVDVPVPSMLVAETRIR